MSPALACLDTMHLRLANTDGSCEQSLLHTEAKRNLDGSHQWLIELGRSIS